MTASDYSRYWDEPRNERGKRPDDEENDVDRDEPDNAYDN